MGDIKNENVFEDIDTLDKAYWLGFLYADGYIGINNKKLQICLSADAECQIDKFVIFVGGDISDKKFYGPYKTSGKQVHYYTRNSKIISDLVKHGCVNKKSHCIRFPVESLKKREIQLSFLKGYFDGDGTLGKYHTDITCGSRLFLEDIKRIFCIKNKISGTKNKYETYRFILGSKLYREMCKIYPGGLKGNNLIDVLSREDYNRMLSDISDGSEDFAQKKELLVRWKDNFEKSMHARKKFNISKEELQKLVDTLPMTKIGEKLGVTGKAIEKRCKLLGIALKGRGYWTKKNNIDAPII